MSVFLRLLAVWVSLLAKANMRALYHISSLISSRFEKNLRDSALDPGAPGQGCWSADGLIPLLRRIAALPKKTCPGGYPALEGLFFIFFLTFPTISAIILQTNSDVISKE